MERTKSNCAGYNIIAYVVIPDDMPDHRICLGELELSDGKRKYATWEYNADSHFYWGHYDLSLVKAYANMYERAAKCCRHIGGNE